MLRAVSARSGSLSGSSRTSRDPSRCSRPSRPRGTRAPSSDRRAISGTGRCSETVSSASASRLPAATFPSTSASLHAGRGTSWGWRGRSTSSGPPMGRKPVRSLLTRDHRRASRILGAAPRTRISASTPTAGAGWPKVYGGRAGARTFARPRAVVPPPRGLVRRGALGDRAPSRAHRRWAPPRYRPPCRRRGRPGPGPARLGGERTDHVHVKDVRREVLESVIADRADMTEAWRRGVFWELGTGDVDLEFFLAALAAGGYSGWLVVEQDRVPSPGEDPAEAGQAQARNRSWLAARAGL